MNNWYLKPATFVGLILAKEANPLRDTIPIYKIFMTCVFGSMQILQISV